MHRMGIKRQLRKNPERVDIVRPDIPHKILSKRYFSEAQRVRIAYEKITPKISNVFAADEIGIFFMKIYFRWILVNQFVTSCLLILRRRPSMILVMLQLASKSHQSIFKGRLYKSIGTYEYMSKEYPLVRSSWSNSFRLLD